MGIFLSASYTNIAKTDENERRIRIEEKFHAILEFLTYCSQQRCSNDRVQKTTDVLTSLFHLLSSLQNPRVSHALGTHTHTHTQFDVYVCVYSKKLAEKSQINKTTRRQRPQPIDSMLSPRIIVACMCDCVHYTNNRCCRSQDTAKHTTRIIASVKRVYMCSCGKNIGLRAFLSPFSSYFFRSSHYFVGMSVFVYRYHLCSLYHFQTGIIRRESEATTTA